MDTIGNGERSDMAAPLTVFVVAFQHKEQGEGVGGFDWRLTREQCQAIEDERAADGFYGPEYEHAIFEYEVPAGLSRDEITSYIDEDYIDALCAAVSS